jgi:hypothetical protein
MAARVDMNNVGARRGCTRGDIAHWRNLRGMGQWKPKQTHIAGPRRVGVCGWADKSGVATLLLTTFMVQVRREIGI